MSEFEYDMTEPLKCSERVQEWIEEESERISHPETGFKNFMENSQPVEEFEMRVLHPCQDQNLDNGHQLNIYSVKFEHPSRNIQFITRDGYGGDQS